MHAHADHCSDHMDHHAVDRTGNHTLDHTVCHHTANRTTDCMVVCPVVPTDDRCTVDRTDDYTTVSRSSRDTMSRAHELGTACHRQARPVRARAFSSRGVRMNTATALVLAFK